jgi:hypothetical protein
MRMGHRCGLPRAKLATVLLASTLALAASGLHAETFVVGPAGAPAALADALAKAKDGDVIEMLPGEYRGAAAVIAQRKLTIRGTGQRPVLDAEGGVWEHNALTLAHNTLISEGWRPGQILRAIDADRVHWSPGAYQR